MNVKINIEQIIRLLKTTVSDYEFEGLCQISIDGTLDEDDVPVIILIISKEWFEDSNNWENRPSNKIAWILGQKIKLRNYIKDFTNITVRIDYLIDDCED